MKNRKKLLYVLLLVIALTSCKKSEQVLNGTKEKIVENQQKDEDISISKEDDVKSERSDDFINILQNESKKNESEKTDNNQKSESSDIAVSYTHLTLPTTERV